MEEKMQTETRAFFDVLTELKVDEKLYNIFRDVQVSRVVLNEKSNDLTFYITKDELIKRVDIVKMQNNIKSKMFMNAPIGIHFKEVYDLPEAYTLEQLVGDYKSSLLTEISEKSHMLYALIKDSDWKVHDNVVTLNMDNSLLAKRKSDELRIYLEEVFKERFKMEVRFLFDFVDSENPQAYVVENETKLKGEVVHVMENIIHI